MTEIDVTSRIKDITLKIKSYDGRISMHKSAIKKLRDARAILMKEKEGLEEDEKEVKQKRFIMARKAKVYLVCA